VIVRRVRHFLATGEVLAATCLPAGIVRVIRLLKELTGGRFEDGPLAGPDHGALDQRPGTDLRRARRRLGRGGGAAARPALCEYAFLTDLQRGQAGPDWKAVRAGKAEGVLALFDELLPAP
jgi:hypothetical protein